MRILVTGSTGFVGAPLVRHLTAVGHDLVVPTRADCGPLEEMTQERWQPLLSGADAVVHLAAVAHVSSKVPDERYNRVNRDVSAVLARASAEAGVSRFVYLSSIRAQVGATSDLVQTEATLPAPEEGYGRSKLAAEQLISGVCPHATILRPALIVGGVPKANLALLARIAALPLPLPFGAFKAPQAVIALDNLFAAIDLALRHERMSGQTYVLAEEPHPSLADMLTWLREGRGRRAGLISLPGDVLRLPAAILGKGDAFDRLMRGLQVDSSKLRAAGWKPPVRIADVLRALGRSGG
jgi:nucleoside-diphosphate-sugar epimerase